MLTRPATLLRRPLGHLLRHLPWQRGKRRVGGFLHRHLVDSQDDAGCLETISLRDGSHMQVDIRSSAEQWAYWTGEYDPEMIQRFAAFLEPGNIVLDVGANIGFYSVALGRRLRQLGAGQVYAFEPVRVNYARLISNIALNGLEQVVSTFPIALGDAERDMVIQLRQDTKAVTENAFLRPDQTGLEASGQEIVRMMRLDTFAAQQGLSRCDLIKVDIEGAELMFLRGGETMLQQYRPVIYGEFNPYWIKSFGHSFLDVAALVLPWGYRLFLQGADGAFREARTPEEGMEEVLLIPKEVKDADLGKLGVVLHEKA
jgi:FkbM family methyltransferase